jgi:hypothetical protein
MPTDSEFPSTAPSASGSRARGALGIFQLLGFGLILMFVLFVLIVVVISLFASA